MPILVFLFPASITFAWLKEQPLINPTTIATGIILVGFLCWTGGIAWATFPKCRLTIGDLVASGDNTFRFKVSTETPDGARIVARLEKAMYDDQKELSSILVPIELNCQHGQDCVAPGNPVIVDLLGVPSNDHLFICGKTYKPEIDIHLKWFDRPRVWLKVHVVEIKKDSTLGFSECWFSAVPDGNEEFAHRVVKELPPWLLANNA